MENDDKTRILHRPSGAPTPGIPAIPQKPIFSGEDTRIVSPQATSVAQPASAYDENKTVILGPTTRRATPAEVAPEPSNQMHDPAVGWLAIISGPGAGGFVRLGYGMNSIGRADDQRCKLNFGDEKISRQNHASVTYDPRGRKFYLQHGGGANLTYIGEMPVLQPMELKGGEFISLADTVLRFVPLCGTDFDYQDLQPQG